MTLREKILSIMTSDQPYPPCSAATLLRLASLIYKAGTDHRTRQYASGRRPVYRLPCRVVSVGNITLGGTGKTPMTLHLAGIYRELGKKAVIISRGYKGTHRRGILVVSDGRQILSDARRAGDEPCLMAHLLPGLPVVVGRDRFAAGKFAIRRFAPDVILLDDGFQHLRLARDLNLLLLDARHPFGNGYLFPRGTLREPPGAVARSDAMVLTRFTPGHASVLPDNLSTYREAPFFRAIHRPVVRGQVDRDKACPALGDLEPIPLDSSWLRSLPLFAFSGLAGNLGFWDAIRQAGGMLKGTMGFADHHRYGDADYGRIRSAARRSGAQCLITTDKDYVRLPAHWRWEQPMLIMGVEMAFPMDHGKWRRFIADSLEKPPGTAL